MRRIVAGVMLLLSATACTPEQLAEWERVNNVVLSPQARETVLSVAAAPAGSKCPQWYSVALEAGWPASDWARLDHVMWRESRCIPTVHNPRGRDDSYGLIQLNMKAHRGWVRPLVDGDFSRLFDPATNLRLGRVLYERAVDVYGCGWRPWATRNTRWC